MVYTGYKTILAMLAAMALGQTDAKVGVCYAPWRLSSVTKDTLTVDLKLMQQHFTIVRTFETNMAGVNIIDVAAEAGVKLAVGVQLGDASKIESEISAVCDGWSRHPETVEVVWVGNELLKNGDFGTMTAATLVTYIKRVQACTNNQVKVGTVQRINEWLSAPDILSVAGACDFLGINVYPWFTTGNVPAIEKLKAQWAQVTAKFDANKCVLTETGWPTAGEDSFGNQASTETMQQFLNDFAVWSESMTLSFWFEAFDSTVSYSHMEYEKNFGVFTVDGKLKVTIPPFTGGGSDAPSGSPSAPPSGTPTNSSAPSGPPEQQNPPPSGTNEQNAPPSGAPEQQSPPPSGTNEQNAPPSGPPDQQNPPPSGTNEQNAPPSGPPDQQNPPPSGTNEQNAPPSGPPEQQNPPPSGTNEQNAPPSGAPEQQNPPPSGTNEQNAPPPKDCAM